MANKGQSLKGKCLLVIRNRSGYKLNLVIQGMGNFGQGAANGLIADHVGKGSKGAAAGALNLIIIMAALALFQATLTLPGIAGLILVIGMAVDSNVLIFERIREELKLGKTVRSAIDAGFAKLLNAGVVLTGGGSLLPGMLEVAEPRPLISREPALTP